MNFGFYTYLVFIISWFTHLTARFHVLGIIRFDLLILVVLFVTSFLRRKDIAAPPSATNKTFITLLIYIGISLPFVYWPGSVIKKGTPEFIKAISFFYFTVNYITSEKKLNLFIKVFILCQSFRIIEPLFLHITQGYWGDVAYMNSEEFMNRLSGAPNDIVNPNGLAFIVLTVFPFYYFLSIATAVNKLIFIPLMPMVIYTLLLTGSRSGFLGFILILFGIINKSKHKLILFAIIIVAGIISFSYLGANFQDRYKSIFSSKTKNSGTSEGRLSGLKEDFKVALIRPVFGFGLGTSREANVHFRNRDQPSHNLYLETMQDLGLVGLFIFLLLIKSIISNFSLNQKLIKDRLSDSKGLFYLNSAMQVWLFMNILFSFASYGLLGYEWYLFAGLSVVMKRIIETRDDFAPDPLISA